MQLLSPLSLKLLKSLVLKPTNGQHGPGHISSASGLVWSKAGVYVISDDELHLAIFEETGATQWHRVLPGELPLVKKARKKSKPDFEVLFSYDTNTLLAIGSGSKPNRCQGGVLRLDAQGKPTGASQVIDLDPIYQALIGQFGQMNIEGAMRLPVANLSIDYDWVLLSRGVQGQSENRAICYPGEVLEALLRGDTLSSQQVNAYRTQSFPLGDIDGVMLGFTDACALPDGSWLYLAAAEDTSDSYLDGTVHGTVLGLVQGDHVLWQTRLQPALKFEGLSFDHSSYASDKGLKLFFVTDADDPDLPSQLWEGDLSSLFDV